MSRGDILWELIFIWIPCTGRCRAQNAADRDKAQHQVELYYAKMYERGYFRDSYNRTSLLWLCGLRRQAAASRTRGRRATADR